MMLTRATRSMTSTMKKDIPPAVTPLLENVLLQTVTSETSAAASGAEFEVEIGIGLLRMLQKVLVADTDDYFITAIDLIGKYRLVYVQHSRY